MKRFGMAWILAGVFVMAAIHAEDSAYSPHAKGTLTFNKDIAPIVFNNCTGCHRAGEVAPFALQTYQDVSKRAKQITRVTHSKYMPPWKPENGFGEFLDERRLTNDQIGMIAQWAEEGAAEGVAADLPPLPKFPEGWALGEPDMVVKMPQAYTLQAEGRDVFRCFVIPIKIDEDKYVTAVDFRPSNRKIVHHALFFLDALGVAKKKEGQDKAPGFASFGGPGFTPTGGLGGWAPGYQAHRLPEGMGKLLRKGSDLVLQVHFHPSGKEEPEQSTVGLYFSKKPAEKVIASLMIGNRKIDIAPGDKTYKVTKEFVTPVDAEVVGITPHAHYLCKDMKVNAVFPDGKTQPMIWIKDWDFSWQDTYLYKTPQKFPKGTKLTMEYTYDNSVENPRNPSNPPQRVHFGEQTKDEMALVFVNYVAKTTADVGAMRREMIANRIKEALSGGGAGGEGK
ncbi:MAG TPA: ascorbate-dependent monooxygenase [Planctomycetota bacterium]|nr:ascorbate-dependent monooxygenase [Planctomycetota bacterium]